MVLFSLMRKRKQRRKVVGAYICQFSLVALAYVIARQRFGLLRGCPCQALFIFSFSVLLANMWPACLVTAVGVVG